MAGDAPLFARRPYASPAVGAARAPFRATEPGRALRAVPAGYKRGSPGVERPASGCRAQVCAGAVGQKPNDTWHRGFATCPISALLRVTSLPDGEVVESSVIPRGQVNTEGDSSRSSQYRSVAGLVQTGNKNRGVFRMRGLLGVVCSVSLYRVSSSVLIVCEGSP